MAPRSSLPRAMATKSAGSCVGLPRKTSGLISIQCQQRCPDAYRQRRDRRADAVGDDNDRRLRITDKIIQLMCCVASVERQIDATSLDCGGVEGQLRDRFVSLYRQFRHQIAAHF